MQSITLPRRVRAALSRLFPALAAASLPGAAAAHGIDSIEHLFGATNVNAQSGNGGLSAGLSARGELTVLSWPSPSFCDQLDYETSTAEDARDLPYFGARPDSGVFAGLLPDPGGDAAAAVTWFRDEPWQHEQSYVSPASAAILHRVSRGDLFLKATETSFVDADRDVLFRRIVVDRGPDSEMESARLLLFANLAPTVDRPADMVDWSPAGLDDAFDFAAYWDPDSSVLVHFAPAEKSKDYSLLTAVLSTPWGFGDSWRGVGLPQMRELLDGTVGEGVFVAIGASVSPGGVQVGQETLASCDELDAWSWTPEAAWDDAQDGELSGSPVAGCRADAALSWDLEFGPPGSLERAGVDVVLALGATELEALETLDAALRDGFDAALARTDSAWDAWLGGLEQPSGFEQEVQDFGRRALLSVAQGTDRESGAIVASLSVQPPYHEDWPRDSTFFDLALDLAGDRDAVTRHHEFLLGVQNREALLGGTEEAPWFVSPPGAWFMNFYADGTPSTTSVLLNPFEIDQVGLMLWNLWAHAALAPNDSQRRDLLAMAWPGIVRGADLLASCVDPGHPALAGLASAADPYPYWWPLFERVRAGTPPDSAAGELAMEAGLWDSLRPCEANEDDHPERTASLYSTHVTRMGLLAAARAARELCEEDARIAFWEARAAELGSAAFQLYYTPGDGEEPGTWDGRADWILWPVPLSVDPAHDRFFSDALDPAESRAEVEAFVDRALLDYAEVAHQQVDDAVYLRSEGAAYENKKTLSLARFWAGRDDVDPAWIDENRKHVRAMAVDLPTQGTLHVGEVWASLDEDGDGLADRAEQRVAVPHLWTATLTWLSAMAIDRPELFEPLEDEEIVPLCVSGEEPEIRRDVSGCGSGEGGGSGCGQSVADRRPSARECLIILALTMTSLCLSRRRRHAQPLV